jgi:peptidoglycan/LPS O-acetylase OafA/YrhL
MPDRDNGPIGLQLVSDFGFVLACACGCFFVAGVSLRFAQWRRAWLDSLSHSAYGMYLIHYVFVVWLQYALLDAALSAITKASIVFTLTVVASWGTMILVRRLPLGASPRGATPRAVARPRDTVQRGAAATTGGEGTARPTRVAD